MTHRPGTAWSRVAEENNFTVPRGLEISDDYIRDEFSGMNEEELASDGPQNGGKSAA
jgi:hypothetical protein